MSVNAQFTKCKVFSIEVSHEMQGFWNMGFSRNARFLELHIGRNGLAPSAAYGLPLRLPYDKFRRSTATRPEKTTENLDAGSLGGFRCRKSVDSCYERDSYGDDIGSRPRRG